MAMGTATYIKDRAQSLKHSIRTDGFVRTAQKVPRRAYRDVRVFILRDPPSPSQEKLHEHYSTGYDLDPYLDRGVAPESKYIESQITKRLGTTASVIEFGCSIGRHLAHFHRSGYEELAGIDINPEAIGAFEDEYPDAYEATDTTVGSFEDVLPEVETNAYDAGYSNAVLMHVSDESEFVFDHIARIIDNVLVTVEAENMPERGDVSQLIVFRNYRDVFESRGFEQIDEKLITDEDDLMEGVKDGRYVARVFRKKEES